MLSEFLLDLVVDPIDHGPLWYAPATNQLYNPRRRVAYEVREAIPVLLPDAGREVADDEGASLDGDPQGRWTGPSSADAPASNPE